MLRKRRILLALAGLATGAAAQSRRGRPAPATARPLVVLDPGHGGRDPGAIGVSGTQEKRIALAAALELRRQLVAGGRARVALTRGGDTFVPLAERVRLAQRQGARLFVSLHADAIDSPAVRGASVYTLNEVATDAQSAALARRENRADRFGMSNFREHPPEVARILASLVRAETRAGSARLARLTVDALEDAVPLLPNPARQAGFMVLKAPDIPAILVEMGFMSNRADEASLRQPAHRARVAACLARAITAYLDGGAIG